MTTEYRRGVLAAFAAVNDLGPRKFIDRDAWVNLNNARGAIRALLDEAPARLDHEQTTCGPADEPTDESRAQSSTATEESCPVCDGATEDDEGNPCARCGSTGTVRRGP